MKRGNQITNLLNRCNKPSVCTCQNPLHIKNIINISNTGKHFNKFISLKQSQKHCFSKTILWSHAICCQGSLNFIEINDIFGIKCIINLYQDISLDVWKRWSYHHYWLKLHMTSVYFGHAIGLFQCVTHQKARRIRSYFQDVFNMVIKVVMKFSICMKIALAVLVFSIKKQTKEHLQQNRHGDRDDRNPLEMVSVSSCANCLHPLTYHFQGPVEKNELLGDRCVRVYQAFVATEMG